MCVHVWEGAAPLGLTSAIPPFAPASSFSRLVPPPPFFPFSSLLSQCCEGLNHGVLLAGYSTSPNGEPYYLIKNSWGASWGEKVSEGG